MPRNRTVRLAVLGSSVQRAASSGYPSTRSSALKRRIVVGVLVVLSLALITLSFRSSKLDPVQGAAATALRPFEIGAERVSRPFRDAVGWTRGLFHAKSDNKELRAQVEELRRQVILNESALQQNVVLTRLLEYRSSPTLKDFDTVTAQVVVNPPSRFNQRIVIAAGSRAGIRDQDVVVTADGLVGQVTKVFGNLSQVTLLTDEESAVTATDVTNLDVVGTLRPGSGPDSLVLERVTKDKFVRRNDTVMTAGSPGKGKLPSLYPRGIPIGSVKSVGQNDTDLFKEIQVKPFVDFSSLQAVLVLVPKAR